MITLNQTRIKKDPSSKKLSIERKFDAPVSLVWRAWTEPELLDQWWAPQPWKTQTKSMDFREGGVWLYSMNGPEGEKHWCRADYISIQPQKNFTGTDAFCNEDGEVVPEPPGMHWNVSFIPDQDKTRVEVEISFASEEALNTIVEMGFNEGFTAAHGNLDELLERLQKG